MKGEAARKTNNPHCEEINLILLLEEFCSSLNASVNICADSEQKEKNKRWCRNFCYFMVSAPVAQLDRAADF